MRNEKINSDNTKKKILIVDNDEGLGQRMATLLSNAGFFPIRIDSCFGALAAIEKDEDDPFAVVVACYQLGKMSGGELLENAKKMAPDTQRMLLIESLQIDSVISGINRAGIHSCMPIPFRDELFVAEVSQRCIQFNQKKKKAVLLKITQRQNKQLYQMAIKLKEKNDGFNRVINKKKVLLKAMTSRSEQCGEDKNEVSLGQLLEKKRIAMTPKLLSDEFKSLSFKIKCFLEDQALEKKVQLKRIEDLFHQIDSQDQGSGWMDENWEDHHPLGKLKKSSDTNNQKAGLSVDRLPAESMLKQILQKEKELDEQLVDKVLSLYLEHEINLSMSYAEQSNEIKTESTKGVSGFHIEPSEDDLHASVYYVPNGSVVNSDDALQYIKSLIEEKEISHGLVDDETIEEWLTRINSEKASLVIARGTPPIHPVQEQIHYSFDVDYRQAGTVREDGTIDFRERGRVPYVKSGTLLAEKKTCKAGVPGTDIFGNTLYVEQPVEKIFATGTNTTFSEDQLKIFAAKDGQPFLSAMGEVSVYQELSINGDVGYETGNIDYTGNLVVSGTIKEGFSVKCANLTAKEIDGGEINVSGNLNISNGIVNSDIINVQGHIQAKFVNNSNVKVFGDIIVQKEIIDSRIFTGGACINERGSIYSSMISAKMGIKAGLIGSDRSKDIFLEVGTDRLMKMIQGQMDHAIKENNDRIKKIEKEILQLDNEEKEWLEKITDFAYEQERGQDELLALKKKISDAKEHPEKDDQSPLLKQVQALQKQNNDLEERINGAFEQQDGVLQKIAHLKEEIETLEESNKSTVNQIRAIREFSERTRPKPVVTVFRTIVANTLIKGRHCSLKLTKDERYCRISEISKEQHLEYAMVIGSY